MTTLVADRPVGFNGVESPQWRDSADRRGVAFSGREPTSPAQGGTPHIADVRLKN